MRRLVVLGALRVVQRSKAGHILEVRLPDEIPSACPGAIYVGDPGTPPASANLDPVNPLPSSNLDPSISTSTPSINLEKLDFLKTRALRQSIHLRERGHCFYCLRRIDAREQCLDHVVPRVKAGGNSYRNLVSCCLECKSQKGEQSAADFFRSLYRERRLTAAEFRAGLGRLDALTAGKLPPPLQNPDIPLGKPAHHRKSVIPSEARYSAASSVVCSMMGVRLFEICRVLRKGRGDTPSW